MERNIEYWKQKNIICADDNISLSKIAYICDLFGIEVKGIKMGFRWKGGAENQTKPQYFYWWPIGYNPEGWQNSMDQDGLYIQESHADINKREENYHLYKDSKQKRITFFKDARNENMGYVFKGVYAVDAEKSNIREGICWKRISEKFNIRECNEL
ncbi:MAG: hypothetical protein LBI94_05055 [Treponema sp.]|jgi:hypothetical protein|nr:hypothetical protein [Treponema sp.]